MLQLIVRPPKERKHCRFCNALFTPMVANQVFCCNEHRDIWYRREKERLQAAKMAAGEKVRLTSTPSLTKRYYQIKTTELKTCPECGKEFLSNNTKKIYCSAECQVIHRQSMYVKKPTTERVCRLCGSIFHTAHAAKIYCSEACRLKMREIPRA